MVDALERHPGVRLSLHYTGPLLEWLRAQRPELVAAIRRLVDRGQIEILGGGWYEPILASLPERDRLVQLERMADEVEATFGERPAGAWLAERVWEPDLPRALAAAGYRWTILDDEHFRAAAIAEDALWGAYTTEDGGSLLTLFGTEHGLRYLIPFGEVDDVIAHLRRNATEDGRRVGVMGDDGEKFGGWPTTYELCWGERRWVDRFFSAIEAGQPASVTSDRAGWAGSTPAAGR
jgi:alpha-amylase